MRTCDHCGYAKENCQCNGTKNVDDLIREQRELADAWNKQNSQFDENEYVRKLVAGSTLRYSISPHENIKDYSKKLRWHVDEATAVNAKRHIWNNGRGAWYTHKDRQGLGCFMCNDINCQHYMCSIIEFFANKYPEDTISSLTS
jgi:hypothetical protein